jgi:hypothetical protein
MVLSNWSRPLLEPHPLCSSTCCLDVFVTLTRHPTTNQVLWVEDSLAIMTGINPDAPIGTKLAFVSGGSG